MRISDWSSDVCSSDLPTLESPIGRRRQYRMWDEVAKVAAECRVAPKALTLLAVLSSVVTVNRRANGTPYRRAKGTPLHDGARLIGHAPLRCARRREGGARPEARAAQSISYSEVSGGDQRSEEHTSELQSLM